MNKQFDSDFLKFYNSLLFQVSISVYSKGTQVKCAEYLGVDKTYLNKVLRGVVAPNARLFVQLLQYAGFDIVKGIETKNGVVYPNMVL